MGTLAYSLTLMLWFNRKILWSLIIKKLSGGHVTSHRIRCLAHCCDIVQPLSVSLEVALHNYKVAQKEYQDLQPKASQLYLELLHQKLLSPGLLDENQQAIHHVLTTEHSRDTFQAICQLQNIQPSMSSMSQIKIPGPDGPLFLNTQHEVKQHLSEALALHFQLTAQSPFLVNPLWFELGLLGTSPAAQAILQGTYQCPIGVDLYTQQLIAVLQVPPRLIPVPLWDQPRGFYPELVTLLQIDLFFLRWAPLWPLQGAYGIDVLLSFSLQYT